MAKIEIDEAALQKVAQDAVKKVEAQVDRDMSGYRGKPVAEVGPALARAMRRHGLEPDERNADFQGMADVISGGGNLR